jgi:hypothetical protein
MNDVMHRDLVLPCVAALFVCDALAAAIASSYSSGACDALVKASRGCLMQWSAERLAVCMDAGTASADRNSLLP